MQSSIESNVEARVSRKLAWRIIPFVMLLYFVSFLDRVNVGFAAMTMNKAIGLSPTAFGLGGGLFFIGYFLFEVPSNLILHKVGARIWIARVMVTWGIVSVASAFVTGPTSFYALRFLLGVAEAGFFPGAILFLSMWVPQRHRNHILALFYLAQPLTIVIGAPFAALLIEAHGLFGLAGWRVMFLGVAVPAIVIGIVAWFYLSDKPSQARWLTSAEQAWLTDELDAEQRQRNANGAPQRHRASAALTSGRVWMFSLMYFGLIYGLYALAFFLPTIIGGFEGQFGTHFNVFQKGLITAIPYLPAAIVLFVWSRDATRRGVRGWHVGIPALLGALSIPLALYMKSPAASIAVITVTACAVFAALPCFWTLPARSLSGAGAAAGIALINTVGNLAGFAAPYMTGAMRDATGSYHAPMFVVGAVMLLSAVLALAFAREPRAAHEGEGERALAAN